MAETLGLVADILTWSPGALRSALQERARQARYGLMGEVCRRKGLRSLVTAHHQDDQAETVLMRLKQGSGWRGAAGMGIKTYAPVWPELAGITVFRPALNASREDLYRLADVTRAIQDPSNRDTRFSRVQVREELKSSSALRDEMLSLARDMQKGRDYELALIRSDFETATLSEQGELSLPGSARIAAVELALPIIGGASKPADAKRLRKSMSRLKTQRSLSLGSGCMGRLEDDRLILSRDPVAMTGRRDGSLKPTAAPMSLSAVPRVWDGRYLVSGRSGVIHPVRQGNHVGFRIEDGVDAHVKDLVRERLDARLSGR